MSSPAAVTGVRSSVRSVLTISVWPTVHAICATGISFAGMAGGDGDAPSAPVVTVMAPVELLTVIRSIRGLTLGAVSAADCWAATSVRDAPSQMKPLWIAAFRFSVRSKV